MTNTDSISIYLVDDDPFCLKLYEQHLHNLGYADVCTFADGQGCLNHITQQPDIIFLDYRMEPLDGLEVIRKIKRFNPDIYLVVISSQEDIKVAVDALKYGAFDYIIKGQDDLNRIEAVLEKIRSVISLLKQKPDSRWNKIISLFNVL